MNIKYEICGLQLVFCKGFIMLNRILKSIVSKYKEKYDSFSPGQQQKMVLRQ